jgi:hypothetical protein
MRGLFFGDDYLAEIAVIACRRTGNKDRRRGVAGLEQIDQPLGYLPAAVA